MLGCDLIGFYVQSHCNNFLDTTNRLLESRVDTEKFSVSWLNKETFVRAFSISVVGHLNIDADRVGLDKEILRIKKEFDLEIRLSILRWIESITQKVLLSGRLLLIDFLKSIHSIRKK
jgi:trehalose 6-phosphate synthase